MLKIVGSGLASGHVMKRPSKVRREIKIAGCGFGTEEKTGGRGAENAKRIYECRVDIRFRPI